MQDLYEELLNTHSTLFICARGLLHTHQRTIFELFNHNRQLVIHLNSDTNAPNNRAPLYLKGGIIAFSSTAVLLDLLNGVLPIDKIAGVLVTDAHKINEQCAEAFILRLIRQKSKTCFIKAFSGLSISNVSICSLIDKPELFSNIQMSMKVLYQRQLLLVPRFHVSIDNFIAQNTKPNLIELRIPLSNKMKQIQSSLMECIHQSLSELKRLNPNIEVDDINVENALFHSFDALLHAYLDPFWHKVSVKTKQLVADIKLLRKLSCYLLTYDAITFYSFLEILRSTGYQQQSHAFTKSVDSYSWLMLDAASNVLDCAKDRVFVLDKDEAIIPVCEEQPKWKCLITILDEIEVERMTLKRKGIDVGPVLIMAEHFRTCKQLREIVNKHQSQNETVSKFASQGSEKLMKRLLTRFLIWKKGLTAASKVLYNAKKSEQVSTIIQPVVPVLPTSNNRPTDSNSNKRRRTRGGSVAASASGGLRLNHENEEVEVVLDPDEISSILDADEPVGLQQQVEEEELRLDPEFFGLLDSGDCVLIHQYSYANTLEDADLLSKINPSYVIMYDPDVGFVRTLEMYQATKEKEMQVYFMMYEDSVQEQKYLTSIRKEKDAFERLIRLKSNMAVPIEQDGRLHLDEDTAFIQNLNTRIAGGQITSAVSKRILVDVREFRSNLANVLHSNNFDIIPCTLEVGDYILSPEICVERKSIADLIQSFKSGRLYAQCESMSISYAKPCLLIEFSHGKAFSLPHPTSTLTLNDIQAKLVLLTIAFPKLLIMWSSSGEETSLMFKQLKAKHADPPSVQLQDDGVSTSMDVLKTLGVPLHLIPKECNSLDKLLSLSLAEMTKYFGVAGKKVYDFATKSVFQ